MPDRSSERLVAQRLTWVKLYEQTGDAGLVCRRCGISRPTLRKWVKRFADQGLAGLQDESRRPKTAVPEKLTEATCILILEMRRKRRLGHRRIQNELKRLHAIALSIASIDKVLKAANVKPLKRRRFGGKEIRRYERPIPGDRIQMDICKIGPKRYQYTAVDDCSRYRVMNLYTRASAQNTLDFLDKLIEEMPFPIQRIQTDRDAVFFAPIVQQRLREYCIKFRPIKPRSPYLNGKVERSQRTDLDEFYATVDLHDSELNDRLSEWQFYYNWYRPHGSLGGKTPIERVVELSGQTPLQEAVEAMYDSTQEREQERVYTVDQQLQAVRWKPQTSATVEVAPLISSVQ